MQHFDYSKFFVNDREVESEYGDAILKCFNVGGLVVPTGKLVACDAFVSHATPYTIIVPPNSYTVILSLARFGDSDQRWASVESSQNA